MRTPWLDQMSLANMRDAERSIELNQWYTPPELAKRMAELVNLKGKSVLEPSAGSGNLVRAALDAGARDVLAIDIDNKNMAALQERFAGEVSWQLGDFLNMAPTWPYDVALMNPPWDDGQHWKHILHALKFAPVVVALAPLAMLEGEERRTEFWDKVRLMDLCICSTRPAFERFGGKMPVACYVILRGDSEREPFPHMPEVRFWP